MTPVLYSFRRCPYAMRARLALLSSKTAVVLREVVLREKPQQFLDISPSATVPCLFDQGTVIDESLDIMKWALTQNDPDRLLGMPDIGWSLIDQTDGPFKHALDRTKYAARFPEQNTQEQRAIAAAFLAAQVLLTWQSYLLCDSSPSSTKPGLMTNLGQSFIHG